MGSSAQNSSGVHWCRRRVRFNEVSEKVAKVPVKVGGFGAEPGQVQQGSGEGSGEGLGGFGAEPSQVRFNRVPEKVLEKVWEALVQSRVRFNRVLEKVPVKVWESLAQSQVRFNRVWEKVPEKVPEKVWEAFGAEPGQVQQGSTGFREALVQSQVRFNRVPGKVWEALVQSQVRFTRVLEKVKGGFGAEPGQVQQGSGGRFRRRSGRLWCRARSGSTGVSSALLRSTRQKDL